MQHFRQPVDRLLSVAGLADDALSLLYDDQRERIAALVRYELLRSRANELSHHFESDIPRVEIASGGPSRKPQYAYSEDEIEATWGGFRWMSPGPRREAMESGYHARIAAFRQKLAEHNYAYEQCGLGAAERAADEAYFRAVEIGVQA